VVIDGTVATAPVVASAIPGGRMQGGRDESVDPAKVREDLEDLAIVLRSGALPAPLMFMIEELAPRIPDHAAP
jgi:preprotein translocase subunit SecD